MNAKRDWILLQFLIGSTAKFYVIMDIMKNDTNQQKYVFYAIIFNSISFALCSSQWNLVIYYALDAGSSDP